MGSSRYCWALAATVLPMLAPMPVLGQLAGDNAPADLGRKPSSTSKRLELPVKKTPRRTRSRTAQPQRSRVGERLESQLLPGQGAFHRRAAMTRPSPSSTKTWRSAARLTSTSKKRQNSYFDHVWTSITQMGQSPHDFIRASNLQWVGAALAAQGRLRPGGDAFRRDGRLRRTMLSRPVQHLRGLFVPGPRIPPGRARPI